MSQFTSIKVKLNDNKHFCTLLAEYGGDCEIKLWILDKDTAWTGELSPAEAEAFFSAYKMTKEAFLSELQKALTSPDPEVLYSLEEKKAMGHIFSWKRPLDTGIWVKKGEITITEVTFKEAYEEALERCFETNSQMQSQINSLKTEIDTLAAEKNEILTSYEKAVEQKKTYEQTLFSQFLAVLNAKKEKIRELQEEVDKLAESEEPTRRAPSKAVSRKRENDKALSPQAATEEAAPRKTIKCSKAHPVPVADDITEADVSIDPYDVDTDVDDSDSDSGAPLEDVTPKVAMKTPLRQCSSDLFDSFEDLPSPVAVLPKRSRLNPKETVKRSLTSANRDLEEPSTSKDNLAEDLLDLL